MRAHVGIDEHAARGIPADPGGECDCELGPEPIAAPGRVARRIHIEHQSEPGSRVRREAAPGLSAGEPELHPDLDQRKVGLDRKSTRLNSSHTVISYAVFCLKKKKTQKN